MSEQGRTPEAAVRRAQRTAQAYGYPLLIRQLLQTPFALGPQQEIVYRDRTRLTYREWRVRVGRLANLLEQLGVKPGTTVAVLDWDSHRYLEAYFAAPMMGAVLQTVNIRLGEEEICYTLNHAAAEVIVYHEDFAGLVDRLRGRLPAARAFVQICEQQTALPAWCAGEYETLLARADERYEFPDFDENAVATTFYTTGTTGRPKAVAFTHRQIVLHTLGVMGALANLGAARSFTKSDVYMPLTPMFHVHAWGLPYVAVLLGVKQVYAGRFDAQAVLRLRERERVTFTHCVPTVLQMLLSENERVQADLRGWKLLIGGTAFPAGLARAALQQGMEVFAAYGMSETAPFLTVTRLDEHAADPQQVEARCRTGLPLPLVDLRIVDEDLEEVAHDGASSGEIVVRAPWLASAYEGDERASEELWRGGYLHTQDVASIDQNGYVLIRDRLKDVVKSGGEWISSVLLEDLISRHPHVREVAVIAAPDERWGERPLALVVPREGGERELSAAGIAAHLKQFVDAGSLSRIAIPERVELVPSLERTSVGKLNKRLMRARYTGARPASGR